jgi:hypothetical protein
MAALAAEKVGKVPATEVGAATGLAMVASSGDAFTMSCISLCMVSKSALAIVQLVRSVYAAESQLART